METTIGFRVSGLGVAVVPSSKALYRVQEYAGVHRRT